MKIEPIRDGRYVITKRYQDTGIVYDTEEEAVKNLKALQQTYGKEHLGYRKRVKETEL